VIVLELAVLTLRLNSVLLSSEASGYSSPPDSRLVSFLVSIQQKHPGCSVKVSANGHRWPAIPDDLVVLH
jgi:hypothetical protein